MIKEALDELVAAYRDLRRMLARELGAEQAADLAQASVERVLAHGRIAAIRSPRAFLFQTARNLQVDHHRRMSCVRWKPLEAEILECRAPEAVTVEATPERQVVSQDLLRRLARLHLAVVTPERLAPPPGDGYWTFEHEFVGAAHAATRARGISGLIAVQAFGCGPDGAMVDPVREAARSANVPLLMLTLDEHSGEAGLVTRLEAFVDMIRWRKGRQADGSLPGH